MVRRLAEKDADVHCVEDYKLIVEGTPIKDLKRTDIDVQQSVPLPRDPVKSELEYKQNPPAQGVWTMTLRRFTRAFKLVFVPAGDLEYEFRPLGGFAAPKPAKWKMFDAYVIKRNTLCFPHQGYQVKWRPLE